MSKIEVGKYELYVEEINAGKLISLALNMVEGHAHEAQVKLVTDDLPMDIQLMADRRALMQVLLNLLSNAIKFTKPGGSVEVKCLRELGGVALIVTDTGIGIPQDKIKIVTMPFEQVDSELTRSTKVRGWVWPSPRPHRAARRHARNRQRSRRRHDGDGDAAGETAREPPSAGPDTRQKGTGTRRLTRTAC